MIYGELDRLHLGDLMQWLQMGALSGRLTLVGAAGDRRLDFLDGRVVFASSMRPDERLGMWLARELRLPVTDLRRCLARALVERRLFTDLLLEAGLVGPGRLRGSVTRLAEHMVRRSLAVPRSHFRFDPSYPVRDLLALTLDLDPNVLLMEAARQRDEGQDSEPCEGESSIPISGEDFERLVWTLLRDGVSANEPVDGPQLESIHGQTRRLVSTLGQWLGASPGLVPLPGDGSSPAGSTLAGQAHATWNTMVLASCVHAEETPPPLSLTDLGELDQELGLSAMMAENESWRRPSNERIDGLTRSVVDRWSRAARVAAPHLGVDPETAVVAVHLLVVPTDLVLWTLATVPVAHQGVRHSLLRRLPRRLGAGLAQLVSFPPPFTELLTRPQPTPLATILQIGRSVVPSAPVWLDTLPDDWPQTAPSAAPEALVAAERAVREAFLEARPHEAPY